LGSVECALSAEESVTSAAPEPDQPSANEPPAVLTRREREVTVLLAQGLTNRRIAQELFISERTVDNHVSNILKKLGLRSREQIAAQMAE